MTDFPELTIGEVADRVGVASSTIRYYESIDLLPKPDREGGQRRYHEEVVGKLAFIGMAQNAGFKLREIAELVEGVDAANGMGPSVRAMSNAKLPEVEALLERTKAMRGWLQVARECGCASPDECALFPEGDEGPADIDKALELVHVAGGICRRPETELPYER